MTTEHLDTQLLAAFRIPRQIRLTYWDNALQEHKKHREFRVQFHPRERSYGFTCDCTGEVQEFRIDIACFKEMLPEAREIITRLFRAKAMAGRKKERREIRRIEAKARALLHRHLTKMQRIKLRATGAFTVRGKDGRTYDVRLSGAMNVSIRGTPYQLCVLPDQHFLPDYDKVLAQKIMLETDPEAFIRLARATDGEKTYESGGFILGDKPRMHNFGAVREHQPLLQLDETVIENPRQWVEDRLGVIPTEVVEETLVERIEVRQ